MMKDKYNFRLIKEGEGDTAADIEQICFPPNEACSRENMKERVQHIRECFLVAEEKATGQMAGFINGLATDEEIFRDEFFTDCSLHHPEGRRIMICGLDVLPEHRGQGLARCLMEEYARLMGSDGHEELVLTCLEEKVGMYRKFGFADHGICSSTWGGEVWHEMARTL